MTVVVQKYGGSSVADIDKVRAVARRVVDTRAAGHEVVVVVSAMGKTTDGLLDLARQASPRPGRRELDMLVSVGERITMALLAMAIHDLGVEAISFTGSQSGIITDERHFDARVVEVRPARLVDALREGAVVIVAGYQGVSRHREVTTLGRGGSDTTAVALAAALGAEWCEICSDVDGVYTADPRVVPDARRIEALSHGEVLEMAHGGARVLAATCVEYARRSGVAIWARSTFAPGPGTHVRADLPARPPGSVVAIAGEPRVPVVRLPGGPPDWTRVMDAADGEGLRWRHAAADRDGLSLWLDPRCHPDPAGAFRSLLADSPGGGAVEEGLGSVTVVGADAAAAPSVHARALGALHSGGAGVRGLLTSPFGFSCLLEADRVTTVVRDLHRELLGPG